MRISKAIGIGFLFLFGLIHANAQDKPDSSKGGFSSKLRFQLSPAISYNLYHFHNTSGSTLNLGGPGGQLGFGALYHFNPVWDVGARLRLDFLQVGKTSTTNTSGAGFTSSITSHEAYQFFFLGIDPTALWSVNKNWVINFGPYLGVNLLTHYRNYGTNTETTGGNTTTEDYGNKSFDNIDGVKKNLQFGINLGLAYNLHTRSRPVQPFFNASYGLNNVLDLSEDNHMTGLALGTNIDIGKSPTGYGMTQEKEECKASKSTRDLKIQFTILKEKAESIEQIANKIPRVEAKITLNPQLSVKQGEECCSKTSSPVSYTELKAGVEAGLDVRINLWGIPDLDYSVDLWATKVSADFKLKIFFGPNLKINFDVIGKAYGELFNPTSVGECKSCVYVNYKEEGFLTLGITAGGKVSITFWPYYETKSGFKVKKEPDESIEASAEASVSLGCTLNGTWAGLGECSSPPPGLHGALTLGKAKANLKFKLELGPISFSPNFEVNLFDGWKVGF
ncbi:MAG: outer membrane beta-barrel protein [Flavisolibacter sp.]